jgi:hypothetical protein
LSPLGGPRILAVLAMVGVQARALQAHTKELGMSKAVVAHAVRDAKDSVLQG